MENDSSTVEGTMPDFIKNLEDCVIVNNRFFCYDEFEKSMVECEIKPIGRSNIPKEAIIAYAKKQMEKEIQ